MLEGWAAGPPAGLARGFRNGRIEDGFSQSRPTGAESGSNMESAISQRHQRTARVAVIVCAALSTLAISAGAAGQTRAASIALAPLVNVAQKLAAYGGYVLFSQYQPTAKNWRLMDWHDGVVEPLDVAPRDMPFDADAGPNAGGRPTVVFSKCAQDPPANLADRSGSQYEREPDWAQARGCRIYELELPSGSPRLVKGIYARGASDSTPAIWKGEIAFARLLPGSHVAKLYLWQRSSRRLMRVGGGQSPCRDGASRCPMQNAGPASAWVDGISLDGQLLSFEWATSTATLGEAPFPELRADPLRDGRQAAPSQVIEERFASGTCGYSEGISPNAVANSILYTTIEGDCGPSGGAHEEVRSRFQTYSTSTRRWRSAEGGPGLVAAVAEDHSATYWISDVPKAPSTSLEPAKCRRGYIACFEPAFEYAQDCALIHGRCTLMRSDGLDFGKSEVRHPGSLG